MIWSETLLAKLMYGSLMKSVNIVSQIPASIWTRELPPDLPWNFLHSSEPVGADIHVIYGLRQALSVPNSPINVAFVASEPPEIRRYNTRILSQYRAVLAPQFAYLSNLPNYAPLASVAPWWVGTNAGGDNHYESVTNSVPLQRSDLEKTAANGTEVVTAIVSEKAKTPMQQQRLRLVDFLSRRLPQFEAYGGITAPIEDKSEVLRRSGYHVAIENSIHPGYWTEKLADPILMDNVTFYGGHANTWDFLDKASVLPVNPWDPEGTYRTISEALHEKVWESSSEARIANKRTLLEERSFHRALSKFLLENEWTTSCRQKASFRAQHPKSLLKKFSDPVYKKVFRGQ